METHFDKFIDRRDSQKWHKYAGKEVIPLWVADTDFRSPEAVITALHQRVAHGIFGYGFPPQALIDTFIERMAERYQWQIKEEWLVFLPGLVCGLNLSLRAFTTPSQRAICPSPIYSGFTHASQCSQRSLLLAPVKEQEKRWLLDLSAIQSELTGDEKLLMLCNPHNPGGTVYRHAELLEQLAFAKQQDLIVCSDEIHCDILLDKQARHIPFASLNEEAEQRTITLMAPSKTFNLAGLGASIAIIANAQLRQAFIDTRQGIVPSVDVLAYVAATAAYQSGQPWLDKQLEYLRDNHELVLQYINAIPYLTMLPLQATYLAWIDAQQLPVVDPHAFFENAGVGLSSGADFGQPKFIRLNFGCQRALLKQALDRMAYAVDQLISI